MTPDKYSNLNKFMMSLAQDPAQLHDFKTKATTMMTQANLSQEEQAIVLSGNPDEITKVLGPNGPKQAIVIVIRAATL